MDVPQIAGAPDGIATLARSVNLLILVCHPGDETERFGSLIAEACRFGRQPVVTIIADGTAGRPDGPDGAARAGAWERAARAAVSALGLHRERLFMFGLHECAAAAPGASLHGPVASAVQFLMWSRDCTAIVAPSGSGPDGVAAAIATAVGRETGVIRLAGLRRSQPDDRWLLPPVPGKQRALGFYEAAGLLLPPRGAGAEAFRLIEG